LNIQQYISSGIIESYLLGLVSEEESAELESMCRIYPELDVEIKYCQQRMERMMYDEPARPPAELKGRILQLIEKTPEIEPVTNYTFINLPHKEEGYITVSKMWKYVVLVQWILLKVMVVVAIFYYFKYRELQESQGVPKLPRTTVSAAARK